MSKTLKCPHCGNDNPSMISLIGKLKEEIEAYFCEVCSKTFFFRLNEK
jgi:transcription elongation factor Elf1